MPERNMTVTLKGAPLTLGGARLEVGEAAPSFTAVRIDLTSVDFALMRGKVCILSSVPSLDTPVCDRQTRRFAEEAGKLGPEVKLVTISMDLPFAQKRWVERAGIVNMEMLSDHREASFGQSFGMLVRELRLLGRGVFVIDRGGTVRYAQIMSELAEEPDYDAALRAARGLL